MHRLLHRQLTRHFGDADQGVPDELDDFVESVNEAYRQADADRKLLERSLELASEELLERNAELRRDLEAQELAAGAVRKSEARAKRILDALPDMVFLMTADGTYLEVHADAADLPARPDELIGRNIGEIFPPEFVAKFLARSEQARETGEVIHWEYDFPGPVGPTHFEARILSSGDTNVLAIVRNVTAARKVRDQLLVADRMASVGTLAAGVSHEVNNPLAYVLANIELVREMLSAVRNEVGALNMIEVDDALGEAYAGAQRVRQIVQDLGTFSRGTTKGLGPVDVRHVLDLAIKLAANEIRHRARLVKQYVEVPAALANESGLAQVFLNLLVNAAQALPVGGAAHNEIRARVHPGPDGRVVIVISDTGPGIPAEVIPRIFDPFFTTKAIGVGTGLGLSVCHSIVTGLGGELSVDSVPGIGATFTVRLPVARVEAAKGRSRRAASRTGSRATRVLIIDDNPAVARSVARLLSAHDVTVVGSGREALEVLQVEDDGVAFDAVVCDLMMPEVTGMDVYEEVERSHPKLAERFLFLTGGAFTERAREFLERFPDRWLAKPFAAKVLRAAVQERADSTQ